MRPAGVNIRYVRGVKVITLRLLDTVDVLGVGVSRPRKPLLRTVPSLLSTSFKLSISLIS
jgi:hypothetical protein